MPPLRPPRRYARTLAYRRSLITRNGHRWNYSPDAERLLEDILTVLESNPDGITRDSIYSSLHNFYTKTEVDLGLQFLYMSDKAYTSRQDPQATIWFSS